MDQVVHAGGTRFAHKNWRAFLGAEVSRPSFARALHIGTLLRLPIRRLYRLGTIPLFARGSELTFTAAVSGGRHAIDFEKNSATLSALQIPSEQIR